MNKKLYELVKDYKPCNEFEENDREVMLEFIKNNEDVVTRNNKIGHFTASAWITNKKRDKVLMIYHNIYNSWSWVGGHADGDDDLYNVICKEIKEETGLNNFKPILESPFAINVNCVHRHVKKGHVVSSHLHFDVAYLFEADENEILKIKEDENSGVQWFFIDDLINHVNENHMIPIYERLNKKLEQYK